MIQSLFVVRVPLWTVQILIGCQDEGIYQNHLSKHQKHWEEIDKTAPVATKDLLRHLIFGEERDVRCEGAYDEITRHLIKAMGKRITANNWLEMKHAADWIEKLDQQLLDRGIGSDVLAIQKHLIERGNPILKTQPGGIGYLLSDEIHSALEAMRRLSLKDRGLESHDTFLLDVRNWLKASSVEGEDLVCFLN
jgi:hypothetical protein